MYNVKKFKILLAVKECNEQHIPAIPMIVSSITGCDYGECKDGISKYYRSSYVKRKPYEEMKRFKCFQYYLDDNGKSALEKYSERYNAGMDLNLRRKPRPFDWSKIELLPGLHILDEIKEKKKGK